MTRCFISLGGNTGQVATTFAAAIEKLGAVPGCRVVATSRFRGTIPVGDAAGDPFLNGAVELDCRLEPLALLDVLQDIELQFGRVRTVRWGPRTLDLDLVFFGDQVIDVPRVKVPHPAAWYRRFVLDPLVEIAPDFQHPEKLATVSELRDRLRPRPLPLALAGGTPAFRELLRQSLLRSGDPIVVSDWQDWPTRLDELALVFWLGAGAETNAPPPARWQIDLTTADSPGDAARFVVQAALG